MGIFGDSSSHYSSRGKIIDRQQDNSGAVCQKCYKSGHWTYQCKNSRVYKARPSRTSQLSNPKLRQKFMDPSEIPEDIKALDDQQKEKNWLLRRERKTIVSKEEAQRASHKKKKKKKRRSPSTSESDSSSSSSDDSSQSSGSSSSHSEGSSSSNSSSSSSSSSSSDSSDDSDSTHDRRDKKRRHSKHRKSSQNRKTHPKRESNHRRAKKISGSDIENIGYNNQQPERQSGQAKRPKGSPQSSSQSQGSEPGEYRKKTASRSKDQLDYKQGKHLKRRRAYSSSDSDQKQATNRHRHGSSHNEEKAATGPIGRDGQKSHNRNEKQKQKGKGEIWEDRYQSSSCSEDEMARLEQKKIAAKVKHQQWLKRQQENGSSDSDGKEEQAAERGSDKGKFTVLQQLRDKLASRRDSEQVPEIVDQSTHTEAQSEDDDRWEMD